MEVLLTMGFDMQLRQDLSASETDSVFAWPTLVGMGLVTDAKPLCDQRPRVGPVCYAKRRDLESTATEGSRAAVLALKRFLTEDAVDLMLAWPLGQAQVVRSERSGALQ